LVADEVGTQTAQLGGEFVVFAQEPLGEADGVGGELVELPAQTLVGWSDAIPRRCGPEGNKTGGKGQGGKILPTIRRSSVDRAGRISSGTAGSDRSLNPRERRNCKRFPASGLFGW
jgi:hypothetical protein